MPKDIFELEGIAPKRNRDVLGEQNNLPEDGLYENYIKPTLNYEAGLGLGMGEGLINSLSSIGNLAPEAYEKLTGKKTGRIPKVDLMKYAPKGKAADIGGLIGNPIGSLAAPGGAIIKGTSKLPLVKSLPEALKAILGGTAAGGALSEGDRSTGALVGGGLGAAATGIGSLVKTFKGGDLQQAIRDTQAKVNKEHLESKKTFDSIEKTLKDEGLSQVPIRTIQNDVIDKAASYMDKTAASKKLIEKAETGDYSSLRKLQAALRVKAEKNLAHDDPAKNDLGREISEVRQDIIKGIENHLVNVGKKDLAEELTATRNKYREFQDVYMKAPYLAKVFGKEQEVPKNPQLLLEKETAPMKKFNEKHPELQAALQKHLRRKSLNKAGKGALYIAGFGGASEVARELLTKALQKNH